MARTAMEAEKHIAKPFRHPNNLRTYAGVKDETGVMVEVACELHTGGSLWETITYHPRAPLLPRPHPPMAAIADDQMVLQLDS